MDDFEQAGNLLEWRRWVFLPNQSWLMWVFRRMSSGQLRPREGCLSVWEVWMMYKECFWVEFGGWKALKQKIQSSVNGGLREKVKMWRGSLSACLGTETPSPIYKEGVWMVLWGNDEGLSRFHMRVRGGLELTWGIMQQLASGIFWAVGKLVLVPSMDLEQPKALKHPATESTFCHFGQKVISCTRVQVLS